MDGNVPDVLRDQGRGVVGALLLGTPLLVTQETWHLAERLPTTTLLAFALGGLLVIIGVLRLVGFRQAETGVYGLLDWGEQLAGLVLQSVVAAFAVLFLFGVVSWGDEPGTVARLVIIQLAPLGLGAAASNALLRGSEAGNAERMPFPRDVAVFALGAIFFSLHVAPSVETVLLPTMAGWWRLAAIIVFSVLVVYLALYELEFRGHGKRTSGRTKLERVGRAFLVYATALTVAVLLLMGYGGYDGGSFAVGASKTIVLSFPAAVGGAITQVGIG